jgi:hypothetical protein
MRRKWTNGLYGKRRRRGLGGARACKASPSKPLFVSFRFLTPSFNFVRGTHTRRHAHSARWGRGISFVVARTQGRRRPVSFIKVPIPLRGGGRKTRIKQTNMREKLPQNIGVPIYPSFVYCTPFNLVFAEPVNGMFCQLRRLQTEISSKWRPHGCHYFGEGHPMRECRSCSIRWCHRVAEPTLVSKCKHRRITCIL